MTKICINTNLNILWEIGLIDQFMCLLLVITRNVLGFSVVWSFTCVIYTFIP